MSLCYVRFGSKADMCSAIAHVCFAPNSDCKSWEGVTVAGMQHPLRQLVGSLRLATE